ncbi:MAG: HNH endonuclease [Candidatus Binataceae bacterium]
MSHGPTYIEPKGSCIYCGARNVRLTDEHIVPYSLGGAHVLREASCDACADITKRFEQKVARDLWGDARTSFGAPSRRKKERPNHLFMPDPNDTTKSMKIPAREFPAGFVFYKMGRAGLLEGLPESVDISGIWQMVVIDDHKRRETFHQHNPGKLVLKFRHVPNEFGRLLAKIGYGQVLTTFDPSDFRPICVPYILGTKLNVSYVVGGSLEEQKPEPKFGYSLKTAAFGMLDRLMLVAIIRLYANTHAPAYHVVVGDVVGPENVANVTRKLGPDAMMLTALPSRADADEHWMPRQMPLPYWLDSAFGA